MIQKYIDCLYNELIANIDTAHKKKVIFILLKTGKVDTVKLIPGWKNIIKTISAQEMFSYIAISLVRNDYLLNSIKFLIEECSYRFENIRDEGNNNLLHEACLYNSFNIAKYLLDHGFDPNKKNILGQTPLHNAIHTDNKMLVTLLVSKKANLNTQDNQKLTPLHVAALYNKNEVKLELIKLKADRSLKEKNGLTYLDLSKMVQKGEIKVASHSTSEINYKKIEGLQKNSTLALFYETLLDKKLAR